MESQKRQEHIFFLATENVIIHVNQPYVIRQDMIETRNFIPEAFLIHQFHESDTAGPALRPLPTSGESALFQGVFPAFSEPGSVRKSPDEVSYLSDDDPEDDDWDDDDEEWDEDDEEWDDEDEEWDEDDEEWDDEDEEFDEDEDWSDDSEG